MCMYTSTTLACESSNGHWQDEWMRSVPKSCELFQLICHVIILLFTLNLNQNCLLLLFTEVSLPYCHCETISVKLYQLSKAAIYLEQDYFSCISFDQLWERSGSVVECLTRVRRAAGSSLTDVSVTALCP